MNELTNFEVLELLAIYQSSAATTFQYWYTITFAAIAASFLARAYLTRAFKHFMASTYLLAVTSIAGAWMADLSRIIGLSVAHEFVAQTNPAWGGLIGVSSILMFALGTGGCVFCIYHFPKKPSID